MRRVLVVGLTRGEGFLREFERRAGLEFLAELDGTRCASCSQGKSRPNATSELPDVASDGELSVTEAARILSVSDSYVRRVAESLGGRKVKGQWQLPRPLVMDEKKRKEGRG